MFKRGQLTIFIIIAILVVALGTLIFIIKGKVTTDNPIPAGVEPVYNTFTSCLKDDLAEGVNIIEGQGGYIYMPEYDSGSDYMPFSSQLNFLGNPIPYWYYVSGNNVETEQAPSIYKMQDELERFIETRARTCFFDNYYSQGYSILMENPSAAVTIKDNQVVLDLTMDFSVSRGEESYVAREHTITLDSQLGSLYNSARKTYEEEQRSLFLENYSVDILRLYAPVDGVEITCSPKIWNANDVFNDLKEAVEMNIIALKNSNNKKDYFDVKIPDVPSNQKIRFLNSRNWSSTFEVNPTEDGSPIMVANPVGNQPGMGILGFCYVPYHFVYSMKYPVLVQVTSGNEIFQFPLAVVIDRNKPRQAYGGEAISLDDAELCKDKNTLMNISLYDSSLKHVDGYVSYECLGAKCNIGLTSKGVLSEEFPQCVNGFIDVKADGYKDESIMYSTVDEGSLSIYLNKIYNLGVQLKIDNQSYNKEAVISFISDDISQTIFYPQQKNVKLAEGTYEVQVYVYKNSTLKFGSTTQQQCVTVPRSSILGIIGLTRKECYDVAVPEQMISKALSAGGKQNYTFSENKLRSSKNITLYANSFPSPDSFEQIQTNYILFDGSPLGVEIK